MSLWRIARAEVAGAWRSQRYDLRRRSDADAGHGSAGALLDDPFGDHDEVDRSPRRMLAISAFGGLAVVGAAGSYFTVVNGLGTLLTEPVTGPARYPLAVEADPPPPATAERRSPTARLRYGTSIAPAPAPPATPVRSKAGPVPEAAATPAPSPSVTRRARTISTPPRPCRCSPPVPTPTSPGRHPSASASATPSASASASASPSPSVTASRAGADGTNDPRDRPRDHPGY